MSIPPVGPTTGPVGAWVKYIAVAVLTVAGAAFGFIASQPTISEATLIAAAVYVIPTAISEFESA